MKRGAQENAKRGVHDAGTNRKGTEDERFPDSEGSIGYVVDVPMERVRLAFETFGWTRRGGVPPSNADSTVVFFLRASGFRRHRLPPPVLGSSKNATGLPPPWVQLQLLLPGIHSRLDPSSQGSPLTNLGWEGGALTDARGGEGGAPGKYGNPPEGPHTIETLCPLISIRWKNGSRWVRGRGDQGGTVALPRSRVGALPRRRRRSKTILTTSVLFQESRS